MKIPDNGDVMNKFEVLGIVGEGESFHFFKCEDGKYNSTGFFFVFSDINLQQHKSSLDFSHNLSREVVHPQMCCRVFQWEIFRSFVSNLPAKQRLLKARAVVHD